MGIEEYRNLRERAIARIEHEDRLFSDRLRNFLMAASFLLAGFTAALTNLYVRSLLAGFGLMLSYFYLHIGVKSCEGIRLWRVTLRYAEETLASMGTSKTELPDEYVRERTYSQSRRKGIWRLFLDTNALQGLWVPGTGVVLWLLLLVRVLREWELKGCSRLIVWAMWGLILLLSLSEIFVFWKKLEKELSPEKIKEFLKPA